MALQKGDTLPTFSVAASGGKTISTDDLKGQWTVIYFYPKDDTPGCTTESKDFRDLQDRFQALNCQVLGVSRDNLDAHERFAKKHNLPFPLLADCDSSLCDLFGVIGEKNLYGRISVGIHRSTFLLDEYLQIRAEWRRVRVAGHAAKVLFALEELQQQG